MKTHKKRSKNLFVHITKDVFEELLVKDTTTINELL